MSRVSCDTHSWPPMILRFLPPSITAHCSTTPTWSAACHVSGPRATSHLPLAYTQALHPSCSSRVTGSLLCHGSSRTWASRKLQLFSIATTVLTLLPWEYLLLSQYCVDRQCGWLLTCVCCFSFVSSLALANLFWMMMTSRWFVSSTLASRLFLCASKFEIWTRFSMRDKLFGTNHSKVSPIHHRSTPKDKNRHSS